MSGHITVRLAWHDDGWNGRICEKPEKNIHCVGCKSYPGDLIRENRDLAWEKTVSGKRFSELELIPACVYSANAFAEDECTAQDTPPDFYRGEADPVEWPMPPASACTWPYEAMFTYDGVKNPNGTFNYTNRFNYATEHFSQVKQGHSLVFYYANYSNPFSTEEQQKHVLVGVSRVKNIGEPIFYNNCSDAIKEKYHNGFVWQRNIESCWPEQGVRLPYHLYKDDRVTAEKFVVVPEQPHVCKYGSKIVSDDEALGLIEQLLFSVRVLKDEIEDTSENWQVRIDWLESLIAELWQSRGSYPGMPAVLECLGLNDIIDAYKRDVEQGKEQAAYQSICAFITGNGTEICGQSFTAEQAKQLRRKIQLATEPDTLDFMLRHLSRVALSSTQVQNIVSESRENWGISASICELKENLYLLAEQYIGNDDSDTIRWSQVDRGAIPSPELSATPLFDLQAAERIRALLLETIRRNTPHVFVKAQHVIEQTNQRLEFLPEWKRVEIKPSYLKVDQEFYQQAITYNTQNEELYLYDKILADDERLLRKTFTGLLNRPEITLRTPRTKRNWIDQLKDESSPLYTNEKSKPEYEKAISTQADTCIEIFTKPIAVLAGGAGTGKSTVATAYINGVKQVEGEGAAICVLAPTGKAADRIRSELNNKEISGGVDVNTIHSLLASNGWLNKNMSIKRLGGKSITHYSTLIIDECSMIDVSLFASLIRAIDWEYVTRVLFVGDPAQLPAIGYGKVYADLVSYLSEHYPKNIAQLDINLRQMINTVNGDGTGILDVAELFINKSAKLKAACPTAVKEEKLKRDELIAKLQDGGDIDKDLRVHYWNDAIPVSQFLIESVATDFKQDGESDLSTWQRVLKDNVIAFQILSPVRGEEFGTEAINLACQKFKIGDWAQRGSADGFHLFDKIIQVRNRTKSNPIKAYDFNRRAQIETQIYNGEIGTLLPKPKDFKRLKWKEFVFRDFCGQFVGKENLSINYHGRTSDKPENNLELAYAISVHKSQGSEFEHVYFVIPKGSTNRKMMELIYTGITRASKHCTLFIEGDVSSLIEHARPEKSALAVINSSLFDFNAVPDELLSPIEWYESGKVHKSLMGELLRSKSEVIVADALFKNDLQPYYEKPLKGKDGSQYLPDFTITYQGRTYYWEHLGMLEKTAYLEKWLNKEQWYKDNGFFDQLIISRDVKGAIDSEEIDRLIKEKILGLNLDDIKKSWDEIIELSQGKPILKFAELAKTKDLPLPIWGYEFLVDQAVEGEIELAWPDYKLGVYCMDDTTEKTSNLMSNDGWTLFEVDELPVLKLVNVACALLK